MKNRCYMNKKSAFTVIEIVITMAIIGIIAVLGYQALVSVDKSVKYSYSNAYYNLDRALYNALYFTNLPNPFVKKDFIDGIKTDVPEEEHPKRLCEMLTEYINTTSVNCNAPAVSDSGTDLNSPHFISTNGMRFYISNLMPDTDNAEHYFMLVFVDVNGAQEPNSMDYEPPETDPDIFAFAALDIGRVCPLGPPEVDLRFMQTRVQYYEIQNDNNEEENATALARFSKVSKPYYISKAEAWGYYLPQGGLEENYYIETNPLTYNGYVKQYISEGSKIYEFLEGQLTVPEDIHVQSDSIEDGGYGCRSGYDEDCNVTIDRHIY